jgi:large subunit ribosomal protein L28
VLERPVDVENHARAFFAFAAHAGADTSHPPDLQSPPALIRGPLRFQHEVTKVARVCDICGKRRGVGNNVSHSNNKTRRTWQPNLQEVRAVVDGARRRIKACTRCIRSGKVTKAA